MPAAIVGGVSFILYGMISAIGVRNVVSPTVAEMADMSPMCSIMAAMAMGAITRMEVRSNLAPSSSSSD